MNKKKYFISIISIIMIMMTTTIFASLYGINYNGEENAFEKHQIKSIDDYYEYIDKLGATKITKDVGPGVENGVPVTNNKNISELNNKNDKNTICNAVAIDMSGKQTTGKLVLEGSNTKFYYQEDNNSEKFIKDWVVLNLETGQKGWYHFAKNGNMTIGLWTDEKNKTYYFNESGINKGMMATGTVDVNGKTYTFSDVEGDDYGVLISQ